ncbi:ParB/RepB/Spo0J family partition protein [Nostoc flagelliforme FACHB-838]|uniref:ParB/RepB/Spo0J family partition protein n=1 Tax=Nostoc flagelliforme FACHB-838 TaxID=2692904 RepID=A0ABR8E2B4_9NOSO|nr:ParB/RepB/Spo0J family partition protein [Nostoc flagelliforme FACHB-838]
MTTKGQNKSYDYFSANAQVAEFEEQLLQSQQRIAELESLNAQLQALARSESIDDNTAKFAVPIDKIVCNPEQVRRYFDIDKLATLTASIKEVGVQSPLWLRPERDGKYLLIAGERRYRAARNAGLIEVPALILNVDDASALKLSLLENLQREDLNPIEETEGILNLLSWQMDCTVKEVIALLNRKAHLDKKKVEWSDENTENVFRKQWEIIESVFMTVGKLSPESFRVSRLPLLNMPIDVIEVLRSGQIEYTKARAIATLKDKAKRASLLKKAIAEKLSLADIRDWIKETKDQEPPSLKREFKDISQKILKSSQWSDPKKAKKIASLLEQLESLLAD